ncbi:hypothetical protein HYC85_000320 [Camellia sinensis]|uniref:Uncharacterized protein n=1 Tax=Camellia sinensis TaxID=4442 RepID=A0A7J7I3I5_CAMSI|nr:hypothetical protein HYC85_000320 [Camellia sinensis]
MQRLSWDPMYYSFSILSLVREEKDDEDSFMVLHVLGKILRYNLGDKSYEKICDVGDEHCDGKGMIEYSLMYFWFHAFHYIEFSLTIHISALRYSFEDKSLKMLCDFDASAPGRRPVSFGGRSICFPFIESHSCV